MNISYQSDNFKKWFTIDEAKKVEVTFKMTKKPMTNQEILDEMKPSVLTLNEFSYILEEELTDKKDLYIAFVKDKNDITRAVYAYWSVGSGWDVYAYELEFEYQWIAGYQVISRKSLGASDTSRDTQTLKHFDTTEVKEKLDDFIEALQELRKTL